MTWEEKTKRLRIFFFFSLRRRNKRRKWPKAQKNGNKASSLEEESDFHRSISSILSAFIGFPPSHYRCKGTKRFSSNLALDRRRIFIIHLVIKTLLSDLVLSLLLAIHRSRSEVTTIGRSFINVSLGRRRNFLLHHRLIYSVRTNCTDRRNE